jgi:hypothetical protein
MCEASCGSMMPAIVTYCLFINYIFSIFNLLSAAAACVKHPAGHAMIVDLFIN